MIKLYEYLIDPNVYAIYNKAMNLFIISTNPNAEHGIIVII